MRKRFIAAAVGATLLLGACQNPPVNNVIDAPLGAPEGVTLDQVRQAIMFAGNKRGWQMRQDVPGKIIATHQRSGHMAVIDILYTTTTFSIVYFDSANLQYKASTDTVHPTYNRWVDFLAQDIQANAAVLATDVGPTPGTAPSPAAAPEPAPTEIPTEAPGVVPSEAPDNAAPIPLAPPPDAGEAPAIDAPAVTNGAL